VDVHLAAAAAAAAATHSNEFPSFFLLFLLLFLRYARHFLTACKRMLGLTFESAEGGVLAVKYNGRRVIITCSHTGTNVETIQARALTDPVTRQVNGFPISYIIYYILV
jgi:hypothetical protein